jgi:hypothetical protein
MDIGSSFCLGASLKFVDEVLDNDIQVEPLFLELFKSLTLLFLTLSAAHDFPFAISTLLSLAFSYAAGGIDHPYWIAFVVVTALLCIVSFSSHYLSFWLVPAILIMPLIVYGEALVFPENSSFEKMLGSAAMIPLLVLFYQTPIVPFLKEKVRFTGFAEKGTLFGIGYFFTRTLIKAYIIQQTPATVLPTTVLSKETTNTPSLSKETASLDSPPQDDEHTHESDSNNIPSKPSEVQ